jgi:hypothetical protein
MLVTMQITRLAKVGHCWPKPRVGHCWPRLAKRWTWEAQGVAHHTTPHHTTPHHTTPHHTTPHHTTPHHTTPTHSPGTVSWADDVLDIARTHVRHAPIHGERGLKSAHFGVKWRALEVPRLLSCRPAVSRAPRPSHSLKAESQRRRCVLPRGPPAPPGQPSSPHWLSLARCETATDGDQQTRTQSVARRRPTTTNTDLFRAF